MSEVLGVRTKLGEEFSSKKTILTTGTFMRGLIHIEKKILMKQEELGNCLINTIDSIKRVGIKCWKIKNRNSIKIRRKFY